MVMYAAVLRYLELGERRCSYCKRRMGWKYMGETAASPRSIFTGKPLPFVTAHGICGPCVAREFPAMRERLVQAVADQMKRRPQRPRRSTLRRRAGGWSGAVACRGRVS